MLMEYVHTNPKYFIRYHASDIILKVFSDAAFIVLRQSRSRSFDIYNLGRKDNKKQNGPIDVLYQTIKNVVASASEAESGGVHLGARHGYPLRIACIELRHTQPEKYTPFETENRTTHGILTSSMRTKLLKSFDMRYWWIKDRIQQNMFDLILASGKKNVADYFTKHHPPWYHKRMIRI